MDNTSYDGAMLFGGVRGELKYYDADGKECEPKDAIHAFYTEFDDKGKCVGSHILANYPVAM